MVNEYSGVDADLKHQLTPTGIPSLERRLPYGLFDRLTVELANSFEELIDEAAWREFARMMGDDF